MMIADEDRATLAAIALGIQPRCIPIPTFRWVIGGRDVTASCNWLRSRGLLLVIFKNTGGYTLSLTEQGRQALSESEFLT